MNAPREAHSVVHLRQNLGVLDRTLRIALGLGALGLPLAVPIGGHVTLGLALFAWVPLVTGLAGWCPLYELSGVSTRR